jgi:hypothetical protein
MLKAKKGYELLVVSPKEFLKLEKLTDKEIEFEDLKLVVVSGVFRNIAGNFLYSKTFNGIVVKDKDREKFGLKPKKKV